MPWMCFAGDQGRFDTEVRQHCFGLFQQEDRGGHVEVVGIQQVARYKGASSVGFPGATWRGYKMDRTILRKPLPSILTHFLEGLTAQNITPFNGIVIYIAV